MVHESLVSRISQVKDLSRSQEVKKNPRNQALYHLHFQSNWSEREHIRCKKLFEKAPRTTMPFKGAETRDLPCGPVVKTPHSQCRGLGFNPWSGN